MYTENGFSVKNFILKVILVVLFVFLLMWLFPMPNLKPVYDRLFIDNVETMKEAAKSYYTVERLPKEVGQTVKMTLSEMLSQKLVLPITDSKGNVCDGDASYVEIKKTDTEYVVKTSLTCGSKSDYVIEHMGCYNICNDTCKVAEEAKEQIKTQSNTKQATKTIIKEVVKETTKETVKETTKDTPQPETKYLYTYTKTISTPTYGPWSSWSSDIRYTDSDHIAFGCTDTTCTEVSPNSPRLEAVGTQTIYKTDAYGNKIPIFQNTLDNLIGSYQVYGCDSYNYTIYQSGGIYKYSTSAQWVDVGSVKVTDAPSNTATERYVYKGAGFEGDCSSECRASYLIFEKYVLSATRISSSTTPSSTIDVSCANTTVKTVNVYGTKTQIVGYEIDMKKTVYAYIKYYRTQSRSKYISTYVDKQTRTYLDNSLLNSGYTLISKDIIK